MLWRAWGSLGISSWDAVELDVTIDVDSLVVTTAAAGDLDVRLSGEALDWCVTNRKVLSKPRLRSLARDVPDPLRSAYRKFAGDLAAHSGLTGIGEDLGTGRTGLSGKSHRVPSNSAAGWAVRMREALGVSARTEILRVLMSSPANWHDAVDISWETAYSRRNTSDALGGLVRGGLADRRPHLNRYQYHVADPVPIERLFRPLPSLHPAWRGLVTVLTNIALFIDHAETAPPGLLGVEATRFAAAVSPVATRLRLPVGTIADREVDLETAVQWSRQLLDALGTQRHVENPGPTTRSLVDEDLRREAAALAADPAERAEAVAEAEAVNAFMGDVFEDIPE
ncbi:MAG: hypothetical protein DYH08_13015 [Actinobacteria bacterium ATB1]|nr:hypothetical protein [Actinobacteria bacterium ATB1]